MKKTKKLGIIIISVAIAVIVVFTFFLNYLSLTKFDNIFEQFIGKTADSTRGDTHGADTEYYKSDYDSASDLYEYEEALVAEMAMEGSTLLENDGLLPLAKGTTLSLFSHSSVDLVSGGSGSGSGSFELTVNLKDGLEAAGLKVNETLWNFYKSGNGSGYKRGAGSINYGRALDWSINECPLSVIKAESGLAETYDGTVAMFVLSRTGGEGADLARDMAAYGGEGGQHYLEPDKTELEIIEYLNETFDDVIILVNANNVMELGWIDDYENISAVINFPGAGRTGTYGLGYMLTGLDKDGNEISASGHLVDTIAYDSFSSPAMQNMGDFKYSGTVNNDYYYVNYAEGIYVGYKYYETRYEDAVLGQGNAGDYDYASAVQYPFGYGLSYTSFEWSDFDMTEPDADGDITVSLTVTNTGDRRGKEVVQVYMQAPYTDYDRENGLEKASVSLVGFEKTDYIGPGESAEVEITVNLEDFVSYDTYGDYKTYILEAGDYYVTAASDAHKALNNVLAARGVSSSDLVAAGGLDREENAGDEDFVATFNQTETDDTTYSVGADGEKITNRFGYAELEDAEYLSRVDWSKMDNDGLRYGTASDVDSGAEIGGKQWTHPVPYDGFEAELESHDSRNPAQYEEPAEVPEFDKDTGVDLIDLRGKDFDDPLWEDLLDAMNMEELALLIDECGYCSPEMPSINKPKVTDLDGPAGLNLVVGHGSVPIGDGKRAMTWPSEYMLASTWEKDFAFKMGEGVGEDGLHGEVEGWYGPAVNIHRTPFAGRNFEYYSEDSFLSGVFGYEAVNGAATKGMYAFLKHFALNDQETHRDHLGLITWAGEQAMREIYLKPFEMVLTDNTVTINYNENVAKDANGNPDYENPEYEMRQTEVNAATGIMSSFNRLGTTWAGGNYNLLTEVLRNEWGSNAFVLTDYEVSSYMHTDQALPAGGDAKLKTVGLAGNMLFGYTLEGKPSEQVFAREAAHRILYTVVNSAGMNGFVHGVEYVNGFAYYKIILIVWDVLAAAGVAVLIFFLVKKIKRNRMIKSGNNR